MLPKVRTRQCRFPTINRGRETALPFPPRVAKVPCPTLLQLEKPGFYLICGYDEISRKKTRFLEPHA